MLEIFKALSRLGDIIKNEAMQLIENEKGDINEMD